MNVISKTALSLILLTLCNCTENAKPIPVTQQFLKEVTVAGAESVSWNNEQNFIQIVLPESYTKDSIELSLEFYDGAHLFSPPAIEAHAGNKIRMMYKGELPGDLQIVKKKDSSIKWYRVYVEHSGPLRAEMPSDTLCILGYTRESDRGNFVVIFTPIKFISGMGTVPSRAGAEEPMVTLTDSFAKINLSGKLSLKNNYLTADTSFANAKNVIVQLSGNGKVFTFPGKKVISNNPGHCGFRW